MDYFETIVINEYYGILDIVSTLGGYASSASILFKLLAIYTVIKFMYELSKH